MRRPARPTAPAGRALHVALAGAMLVATVGAPMVTVVLSAEIVEIVETLEKSVVPVMDGNVPLADAREPRPGLSGDLQPVHPHPEAPPTPPPEG